MKKSIFVTGVAGVGKSAICKELKRQGYKAYDIEDMEGFFSMVDKKTGKIFTENDNDNLEIVKQRDWICDVKKLRELIESEKSDMALYCGTASNLDEILPFFDVVVLLRSTPEVLRKRLSFRPPGDFGRTKEVQDWIFGQNWLEEEEKKMREKGAIIIDTDKSLEEVAKNVIKAATTKKLGK